MIWLSFFCAFYYPSCSFPSGAGTPSSSWISSQEAHCERERNAVRWFVYDVQKGYGVVVILGSGKPCTAIILKKVFVPCDTHLALISLAGSSAGGAGSGSGDGLGVLAHMN